MVLEHVPGDVPCRGGGEDQEDLPGEGDHQAAHGLPHGLEHGAQHACKSKVGRFSSCVKVSISVFSSFAYFLLLAMTLF